MNVKELKEILNKYPEDLEIIYNCCSDYSELEDSQKIIKAVPTDYGWVMRSHPTMSKENKAKEKEYLLLC